VKPGNSRSRLAILSAVVLCGRAASDPALASRALQEFRNGKYEEAERDFREITRTDPSDVYAQVYLGQTLFKEEKYTDAAHPFEGALALEEGGHVLSSDQHRIIVDQLAMAYGISGQAGKAHELLEKAVSRDPEYPLNYYNLACVFAGEGNRGKMLTNLDLAFHHKDHVLKGEQMPDPRTDPSFQRYLRDDDFVRLMKALGFK